ncbi:MAG: choice-of-anchor I family protein [Rhodospirillales bacterium]|nr:choice-of-anchor I family protein [Rhodospirillales bacterium]
MAIELTRIGAYRSGVFDQGAAEISAFDPVTQRLFVVNGAEEDAAGNSRLPGVDVLDLSDPAAPELLFSLDFSGRAATSVAVANGMLAVALPQDPVTDAGEVAFFPTSVGVQGFSLGRVTVGALPDMLTFAPDGQRILVANEGEPDEGVDPEGSISIIDLSSGVIGATARSVDFSAFTGLEETLRAKDVRIFPGKTAAEDFEPEYIAISPDGSTAFVTLQENNAFAVVDIAAGAVLDIVPLGHKNHGSAQPTVTTFDLTDQLPLLGITPHGQEIDLGGLSGLFYDGMTTSGLYRFYTLPDRGPNAATSDLNGDGSADRPFVLPEYQARIVEVLVDPASGEARIGDQLPLSRENPLQNGSFLPITGISNNSEDEPPVNLHGQPLPFDPFGGDFEGIAVETADHSYWMVDEYRPAIYHFSAGGVLIDRFVPEGTAAAVGAAEGTYGSETLPEEYANRRPNRGFEAVAIDEDEGIVFAWIQTPLANPDRATSDASDVIRILGIDIETGAPVKEFVQLLEAPGFRDGNVDKIGDAVFAGNGRFFVNERDDSLEAFGKKFVFEIDTSFATNVLGMTFDGDRTLEQLTAEDFATLGITPVAKTKVLNLPSIGYDGVDKSEGLALLPDGRLAVLNDNDFGLLDQPAPGDGTVALSPDRTKSVLGLIAFDGQSNGLDASDSDDAIAIQNWPVFGMYMPDAVTSFAAKGQTFYVTANEGDARDEVERIGDLALDPEAFPDAAALQEDENLGRLEVSTIDGDPDGDGDFDQLFSYGARSFSIWDAFGNLVFDSGDQIEQITAERFPEFFNASNDGNEFDSRSDNKGPEPEGVTVAQLGDQTYAFIGLERIGGVMVYDVSDPHAPTFVDYVNDRDFAGDPENDAAGDLGPEGLTVITADESPNGAPLLVVTNEVSGSTSIYQIDLLA